MKHLLTLLFLIPVFVHAQDNIRLTDGTTFNCKILSSDKDYVVFSVDSAGSQRKVPRYMVKEVNYNSSLTKPNTILNNDSTIDPILVEKPVSIASLPPLPKNPEIQNLNSSGAQPFFIIGAITGVLAFGSAIGYMSLDEPQSPIYNGDLNQFLKDTEEYEKAAEEYTSKANGLFNMTLFSSTLSLLSTSIGAIVLVATREKEPAQISLKQKGAGISICYRF